MERAEVILMSRNSIIDRCNIEAWTKATIYEIAISWLSRENAFSVRIVMNTDEIIDYYKHNLQC